MIEVANSMNEGCRNAERRRNRAPMGQRFRNRKKYRQRSQRGGEDGRK